MFSSLLWARSFRTVAITAFVVVALLPVRFLGEGDGVVLRAHAAPTCTGGQLGGTVFRDFNSSGAYDAAEVYVPGITVSVYDSTNTQIDTATTDANGEYVLSVPNGTDVRVEMTGLPSYMQVGQSGSSADSSVRFITNADTCDVDFAVINPSDYCEDNPQLSLACYSNGEGAGNTTPGMVTFPYNSSGLETDTPYTVTSEIQEIGTVWGTAWQSSEERFYASTFLKRQSTMKDGPGHVYVYDYASGSGVLLGSFDLQGVTPANGGSAIDLGTVCRDSGCGVANPPTSATTPWHDQDAFGKVAKMSFGDIDMTEDSNELWLVNLYQQSLISIDMTGADPLVPGTTNQYDIASLPGAPSCVNGEIRPWALKFRDGQGHLGVVCDASVSADSNDLSGYILAFDPNDPMSGFTTEVTITSTQFLNGQWQFWTDDWATLWPTPTQGNVLTNLPLIMDIEFEADGDMVVAVGDRVAHMGGFENYGPDTTNTTNVYTHFGHGDVTSFCNSGSGYVLEPTTGCPGNYSSSSLNGWTEYYQDESADNLPHNSMGGFAMHYSQQELVSVVIDPFPVGGTVGDSQYFHTGGLHWYDVTTGAKSDYYRLYPSMATELFGKASGLGDVEMLCSAAPIEIGNRVWLDADQDGIQDAGEDPIGGVTVRLYNGTTEIGTATTDSNGHYYFGGSTDANIIAGSLHPNTSYTVRIDTTQAALTSYEVATADAGSNANDMIDSDGVVSGDDVEAVIVTDGAGNNRHMLDFGFTADVDVFDLALLKEVQTSAPYYAGQNVVYSITVYNQGDIDATSILVQDALPTGITPNDAAWADIGNNRVTITIPSIAAGQSETITLTATIGANATGSLVNVAEIVSALDGAGGAVTDVDSNPDADPTDDPQTDGVVDNSGGDEDDNDPAGLTIADALKGTIGNYVWVDANADGVQDASEVALSGVTVTLTGTNSVTLTTTTDSSGIYAFTDLDAGTYVITITPPDGYTNTFDADGTVDGQSTYVLGDGENNVTQDFGLRLETQVTPDPDEPSEPSDPSDPSDYTGSIGNTVYHDENLNCDQDKDEDGIEDVRVDLTWAGPDNDFGTDDDQTWTTKTDDDGKYVFENLPPGRYEVDVDMGDSDLKGYTIHCDGDGNHERANGIDQLTLDSGDNYTKADFGFITDEDEQRANALATTGTNLLLWVGAAIIFVVGGGVAWHLYRRSRRKG